MFPRDTGALSLEKWPGDWKTMTTKPTSRPSGADGHLTHEPSEPDARGGDPLRGHETPRAAGQGRGNGSPDLLLLDEPTNHLDIDAIRWLENSPAHGGALLFVTHDRALLRKVATRILELDRGRLPSWSCDYATYLKRERGGRWKPTPERRVRQEAGPGRGLDTHRDPGPPHPQRRPGPRLEDLREVRRERRDRPVT